MHPKELTVHVPREKNLIVSDELVIAWSVQYEQPRFLRTEKKGERDEFQLELHSTCNTAKQLAVQTTKRVLSQAVSQYCCINQVIK